MMALFIKGKRDRNIVIFNQHKYIFTSKNLSTYEIH